MKNFSVHAALFTANLIYAMNYTIAKDVMPEFIKPFGFILLRVVFAASLFWLVSLFGKQEKVHPKDLRMFFVCGIFGVAVNQLCFFKGLSVTVPINASVLMTSTPILVMIIAAVYLKNRITKNKIFGITLGLIGALMIILMNEKVQFASNTFFGDILVVINALSYGLYLVLVKPLMSKYSPITVTKWVFTFGLLMVIPFSLNEALQIEHNIFQFEILWRIFYVLFGTTFLAYFLNIYALKKASPSLVSFYLYIQPLLATIFAILMGSDRVTWVKIFAGMLLILGVYLISKTPRKQRIT
ncbi:MAG: DMT family transporter [Flavobacteriales bacterium]|nr:DMT family transporter [Flavobacteriales bacterium]